MALKENVWVQALMLGYPSSSLQQKSALCLYNISAPKATSERSGHMLGSVLPYKAKEGVEWTTSSTTGETACSESNSTRPEENKFPVSGW